MVEPNFPVGPNTPETAVFAAAASEGRLLIRRCTVCTKPHWYPRAICPFCAAPTMWEEASGFGVIYSYSTSVRSEPHYTLAYVTLAEGPTMLTNIVDAAPESLAIGQPVTVDFRNAGDGTAVPCFVPA